MYLRQACDTNGAWIKLVEELFDTYNYVILKKSLDILIHCWLALICKDLIVQVFFVWKYDERGYVLPKFYEDLWERRTGTSLERRGE